MTADIKTARLDAAAYEKNFSDIHPPLNRDNAFIEASRCYFCHDAPCVQACPTRIDIPMFIRKIGADNAKGAAVTILNANIMGGACARVCPVEELCEDACVRNTQSDQPVKIGALQRFATDELFSRNDAKQVFTRKPATGKKIAIVGAGPAGLTCAHELSREGHEVTIYEARPKSGGLNEYGIAAYKVPNDFAQKEVDYILSLGGITIRHGQKLGQDITLEQLRKDYAAVFLALGHTGVNALGLEGENLAGVESAVGYIEKLRTAKDKSSLPVGRRVVVIGGGNTAIDMAIQIKRLGAEDVTLAYRRGPENMSATDWECDLAQTNDVRIRHWFVPKKLHGENGHVTAITFDCHGQEHTLPADQVFTAIGQKYLPDAAPELKLTAKGRIATDENGQTSLPGVFAGGDCTEGQDLTVAAVAGGKRAAIAINEILKGKK